MKNYRSGNGKRIVENEPKHIGGINCCQPDIGEMEALRREARANRIIAELSSELMIPESMMEISRLVLNKAMKLFETQSGYAGYIQPQTGCFSVAAIAGKATALFNTNTEMQYDRFTGIWGWGLSHKSSLMANSRDELVRQVGDDSPAADIGTFISAPALIDRKVVGQIAVLDTHRNLSSFDCEIINRIASLYASALQRIKTNDEIVNARKEAEAANQKRNELLSNMSHEIRTPMNGILGMLELALEIEKNPRQMENLYLTKDSAEALLNLMNNLFNFSEIEAGKLKIKKTRFGLRSVVESVLSSFRLRAQGKSLELLYEISSDTPNWLIGDPERLRQILVNIIGNAVKFTEKGKVVLCVEVDYSSQEMDKKGVVLRFSVQDTGIGIPGEKLESIFSSPGVVDKEISRSYGGIGLGLVIARQMVEMMSGRIWVESQINLGSTFYFTAWFEKQPQTAPALKRISSGKSAPVDLPKRKIFDIETAKNCFSNNINKIQESVNLFVERGPVLIEQLKKGLSSANYSLVEQRAEELNKKAAQIGAMKISGEAFRLKIALRNAESMKMKMIIDKIDNEFRILKDYLVNTGWD